VIPIYYVLGERLIQAFGGAEEMPTAGSEPAVENIHGGEL